MPIWLRVLILLILFPLLFIISTLVVIPPAVLWNALTGAESLLAGNLVIYVAQLLVGCVGAVWLSGKLWNSMSQDRSKGGLKP